MNRRLEVAPTLPKLLAGANYVSLQTGKWWQGNFRRGGFTHGMTRGDRHGDAGIDIGRKTMQPIYDFIAQAHRDEQPFFVWYAPMMPHQAHNPPQRLLSKYETENTIVVYVTDNGWITDPQTGEYAPKSKQSPYDGGLRTPIMIRWPERVEPLRSDALALSIDIVPTLLAAVGAKPTPQMHGIDLLDGEVIAARKAIFGECFTHESKDLDNPAASLRWRWTIEGPWKLILPDTLNEPDCRVELYNLVDDPHEERNLAGERRDRVENMRENIDHWWSARR
jgi:uncharacterized sulfatase